MMLTFELEETHLKKLRPNCGEKGWVNTLSNKKCLVDRTDMRALHSPDTGEGFTYSDRASETFWFDR